jgi:hypothetical protein
VPRTIQIARPMRQAIAVYGRARRIGNPRFGKRVARPLCSLVALVYPVGWTGAVIIVPKGMWCWQPSGDSRDASHRRDEGADGSTWCTVSNPLTSGENRVLTRRSPSGAVSVSDLEEERPTRRATMLALEGRRGRCARGRRRLPDSPGYSQRGARSSNDRLRGLASWRNSLIWLAVVQGPQYCNPRQHDNPASIGRVDEYLHCELPGLSRRERQDMVRQHRAASTTSGSPGRAGDLTPAKSARPGRSRQLRAPQSAAHWRPPAAFDAIGLSVP